MMLVNVDAALKRAKINGYVCLSLGVIVVALSIILAILLILDRAAFGAILVIIILEIPIGTIAIIKAHQMVKVTKLYHKYLVILSRDPEKSLYTIASSTKTPIEEIKKNIKLMIRLKFFPGAKLDKNNYRIIFPDDLPNIPVKPIMEEIEFKPAIKTEKYVSVSCKNCGAPGKIISGTVGECEFCGSPLSN